MPPSTPTHLTGQMEIVSYINQRFSAKKSDDPDIVAWYVGLSGNAVLEEQFGIAKRRVESMVESGWSNLGNYYRLESFLASRSDLSERIDDDPTRFTSVPFIIDGERRYFLLEAPARR